MSRETHTTTFNQAEDTIHAGSSNTGSTHNTPAKPAAAFLRKMQKAYKKTKETTSVQNDNSKKEFLENVQKEHIKIFNLTIQANELLKNLKERCEQTPSLYVRTQADYFGDTYPTFYNALSYPKNHKIKNSTNNYELFNRAKMLLKKSPLRQESYFTQALSVITDKTPTEIANLLMELDTLAHNEKINEIVDQYSQNTDYEAAQVQAIIRTKLNLTSRKIDLQNLHKTTQRLREKLHAIELDLNNACDFFEDHSYTIFYEMRIHYFRHNFSYNALENYRKELDTFFIADGFQNNIEEIKSRVAKKYDPSLQSYNPDTDVDAFIEGIFTGNAENPLVLYAELQKFIQLTINQLIELRELYRQLVQDTTTDESTSITYDEVHTIIETINELTNQTEQTLDRLSNKYKNSSTQIPNYEPIKTLLTDPVFGILSYTNNYAQTFAATAVENNAHLEEDNSPEAAPTHSQNKKNQKRKVTGKGKKTGTETGKGKRKGTGKGKKTRKSKRKGTRTATGNIYPISEKVQAIYNQMTNSTSPASTSFFSNPDKDTTTTSNTELPATEEADQSTHSSGKHHNLLLENEKKALEIFKNSINEIHSQLEQMFLICEKSLDKIDDIQEQSDNISRLLKEAESEFQNKPETTLARDMLALPLINQELFVRQYDTLNENISTLTTELNLHEQTLLELNNNKNLAVTANELHDLYTDFQNHANRLQECKRQTQYGKTILTPLIQETTQHAKTLPLQIILKTISESITQATQDQLTTLTKIREKVDNHLDVLSTTGLLENYNRLSEALTATITSKSQQADKIRQIIVAITSSRDSEHAGHTSDEAEPNLKYLYDHINSIDTNTISRLAKTHEFSVTPEIEDAISDTSSYLEHTLQPLIKDSALRDIHQTLESLDSLLLTYSSLTSISEKKDCLDSAKALIDKAHSLYEHIDDDPTIKTSIDTHITNSINHLQTLQSSYDQEEEKINIQAQKAGQAQHNKRAAENMAYPDSDSESEEINNTSINLDQEALINLQGDIRDNLLNNHTRYDNAQHRSRIDIFKRFAPRRGSRIDMIRALRVLTETDTVIIPTANQESLLPIQYRNILCGALLVIMLEIKAENPTFSSTVMGICDDLLYDYKFDYVSDTDFQKTAIDALHDHLHTRQNGLNDFRDNAYYWDFFTAVSSCQGAMDPNNGVTNQLRLIAKERNNPFLTQQNTDEAGTGSNHLELSTQRNTDSDSDSDDSSLIRLSF